jgi:hypothetical protein
MAFCQGIAVLGIVAGLLAIYLDGPVAGIDEVLAAGLPIAGVVLGLALILRARATTDRPVAIQAIGFVLGLGVLGPIVAVLATISADNLVDTGFPGPYLILGLAQLGAILGIARTSAGSIQSMRGADLGAARAIMARQMVRSAIFELVGAGSAVTAIWLVIAGANGTGGPG